MSIKDFLLKVLKTAGVWLFLWPISTVILTQILGQKTTEGTISVDSAGGTFAIFAPFILAIILTVKIFLPKKNASKITESDILYENNNQKNYLKVEYGELKFFEKIFGPTKNTKLQSAKRRQELAYNVEAEQLKELIKEHREALNANWQRTVTQDEYGTKDYSTWIGELERFFQSLNYEPEEISYEDALKIATYEVESFSTNFEPEKERTVDEKADQVRLMGLVEAHKNALIRNWHKTVEQDDYGRRNLHAWHEEIGRFLNSVSFSPRAISYDLASVIVTAMVEDLVAGEQIESVFDFDEVVSAYDFEEKCAEELSRIGWVTKVTSGSGDQGIDVLAVKNSLRVVIQCKLYSRPVRNKAVQEAISGKAYEKADHAAVVAPNGFTRSAIELAQRDGVFLLSPKDLKLLDRYIEE